MKSKLTKVKARINQCELARFKSLLKMFISLSRGGMCSKVHAWLKISVDCQLKPETKAFNLGLLLGLTFVA